MSDNKVTRGIFNQKQVAGKRLEDWINDPEIEGIVACIKFKDGSFDVGINGEVMMTELSYCKDILDNYIKEEIQGDFDE